MKIAFILYPGLTSLDLVGAYDPLMRLKRMTFIPDLSWDLCSLTAPVADSNGLGLSPTRIGEPLVGYDLLVVPGGPGSREKVKDSDFITWLQTARSTPRVASVSSGALLLAAAGFLKDHAAATHPEARQELAQMGVTVRSERLVHDGNLITSGGATAGIDLGLYLCQLLAGEAACEAIRRQMDYPLPPPRPFIPNVLQPAPRYSRVVRATRETRVEVALRLDGSGQHTLATGLPFLDHMLAQVAVHGLFDLDLRASGDLEVDPHHTVEDIALALGQAFFEALGDRAGIVRMASAACPMDDSLAIIDIDLSGRPYAIVQTAWHTPAVGVIPTALFDHFLESFASQARCNLHARVVYSKEDHHQAEALFKALGRALSAAVQIDPRRAGQIPSSKGVL